MTEPENPIRRRYPVDAVSDNLQPVIRIEVEWLADNTIRELEIQITAIRNLLYHAGCPTNRPYIEQAMAQLATLRTRLGIYRRTD